MNTDSSQPVVTISIEIELGWGKHYLENSNKYQYLSKKRKLETSILQSFLEVCDDLNIPITFNIVGHLFLDACGGEHSGDYYPSWFSEDPGTNVTSDPLFYAPDLIDEIKTSDMNHEIATHTFSHILFDEVDEAVVNQEFSKVIRRHKDAGLQEPSSLVTPQHKEPPYDVLRQHGIRTLRTPDQSVDRGNWPIQSINVLRRPHVIRDLEQRKGILQSYCTPWPSLTSAALPKGQSQTNPPFSWLPLQLRQRIHKRKLRQALQGVIEDESHLHLWTHLFNMANEPQWSVIEEFLQLLEAKVAEEEIEVQNMKDLHQYVG